MSRPKVADEERRIVNFTIRLTTEEQRQLEQAAIACGRVPAVLIRDKVFKGRFPKPQMAKIELQTYLELKKIGVNINQLARHANSGMLPFGINAVLDELIAQQQKIIRILLNDSDSENR